MRVPRAADITPVPPAWDKRALRGELATKDAAIAALRRDLDELATRDPCTRLYHHGPFRRAAAAELERAAAAGRPVSLVMVDIDGFRVLNQRRGPDAARRSQHPWSRAPRGERACPRPAARVSYRPRAGRA